MRETVTLPAPGKIRTAELRGSRSRGVWRRKVRNTFLQLPILFQWFIRDADFDRLLRPAAEAAHRSLAKRALGRLWFWPRITDAAPWAEGREGRLQTPLNYVDLDDQALILLEYVDRYASDHQAAILDLGCNSGRHLNHLWELGYTNLTGVDGMGQALRVMGERFPRMKARAKIQHDLFQRFLSRQPDRSFDLVYSHGATVELVHPSFDLIRHLCRITRCHVILLIDENGHAYPRFWRYEFFKNGFDLVWAIRPVGQCIPTNSPVSLLVFQRAGLASTDES